MARVVFRVSLRATPHASSNGAPTTNAAYPANPALRNSVTSLSTTMSTSATSSRIRTAGWSERSLRRDANRASSLDVTSTAASGGRVWLITTGLSVFPSMRCDDRRTPFADSSTCLKRIHVEEFFADCVTGSSFFAEESCGSSRPLEHCRKARYTAIVATSRTHGVFAEFQVPCTRRQT